LGIREAGSNYF